MRVAVFLSAASPRHALCVRCVRVIVVFSFNQLTSLPESFGNLTQLTKLDL